MIGEYDSTGNEIKTYGWAPDSLWSTDPLFLKIGGTYYWYQNDHLGTPQKLIGTNGLVVWSATYDSFGNMQITTEEIRNNLRFPGNITTLRQDYTTISIATTIPTPVGI